VTFRIVSEFCAFLYASGVSTVSYIALDDEFDVIYSGQVFNGTFMIPFGRLCYDVLMYANGEYMVNG